LVLFFGEFEIYGFFRIFLEKLAIFLNFIFCFKILHFQISIWKLLEPTRRSSIFWQRNFDIAISNSRLISHVWSDFAWLWLLRWWGLFVSLNLNLTGFGKIGWTASKQPGTRYSVLIFWKDLQINASFLFWAEDGAA
jgi:hypothetical protein